MFSAFPPSHLVHTEPTSPSRLTTQHSSSNMTMASTPFPHTLRSDMLGTPQDADTTTIETFYNIEQSFLKDTLPEAPAEHDFKPVDAALQQHLQQSMTPEYQPPAQRTRRKRSRNRHLSETQIQEKRQAFLKRNRIAAAKCRTRKENWTSSLTGKVEEKLKENNMLMTLAR